MYLYTPTLSDKEIESGATIDPSYDKGMWYAPSVGEMSLAIYCRGLSVSSAFSSATIKNPINAKATSDLAIFTKAYNKMGSDFNLTPWADLLSAGNNIITNVYSTGTDNYGYLISVYTNNGVLRGSWKEGIPSYDVTGQYTWEWNNDVIWRMNKHYGIPFTQYNYAKPNN